MSSPTTTASTPSGPSVAVGFFFLISGFLIPLTMDGKSVGRFLINRVCRIYPVWLVSLLIIAGLFGLEHWLADVPVQVPAGDLDSQTQ